MAILSKAALVQERSDKPSTSVVPILAAIYSNSENLNIYTYPKVQPTVDSGIG